MLLELLMGMAGHSGDVVIATDQCFQLDKDASFLHKSEKIVINSLCQLGYYYHNLKKFTDNYKTLPYITLHKKYSQESVITNDEKQNKKKLSLMYTTALCTGIDEILDSYLLALTKAEQQILKEPVMPLSYLKLHLSDYEILFPHLHDVTKTIEKENLIGGRLLDYLYTKSLSGIPIIKSAMQRLLFHCNAVLIRSITNWMVYGILPANSDEFFITQVKDEKKSDDKKSEEDDKKIEEDEKKEEKWNTWDKRYTINTAVLPSYISFKLAKKILFIGRATTVLQQNKSNGDQIPQFELHRFSEALKVHEKAPNLHITSFECTIDRIRTRVAKYLWDLIVVDAALLSHLQALKDYYLLSRGDFYQTFITDTKALMSMPPSYSVNNDLQMIFKQVRRKSSAAHDEHFKRLKISMNSNTVKSKDKKQNLFEVWGDLYLDYKIEWPLHLLFTQEILAEYNRFFRYLLKLKRVQIALQQCWATLNISKKKHKIPQEPFLLRSRMSFLIDNLQFFLHVDIIDVQFSILKKRIENSQDFEEARKAHDTFLTVLANHSLLNVKQIMNTLDKICILCIQFCDIIQTVETNNQLDKQFESSINQIAKEYQQQAYFLFQILSGVRGHASSPHLSQLLLRFDYNKYFTGA